MSIEHMLGYPTVPNPSVSLYAKYTISRLTGTVDHRWVPPRNTSVQGVPTW
jgi:hypothetical protein